MVQHRMLGMPFDFWVKEVLRIFHFSHNQKTTSRLGCNPKVKNLEGLIPKKIADQCKAKDAKKNMRKSEKGYTDMTTNLRPGK
jgi:hypothetical protein